MEKNNGGAKPKTGPAANSNNSSRPGGPNGTSGGGSSQHTASGTHARNRSPRREPASSSRSNPVGTRAHHSVRGSVLANNSGGGASGGSSSNNNTSSNSAPTSSETTTTTTPAAATTSRRPGLPNSVARNRYSSSSGSNPHPHPHHHHHHRGGTGGPHQRYNDYSPLRGGGGPGGRSNPSSRQPVGAGGSYSRPALRQRNTTTVRAAAEPALMPLESPTGDLHSSASARSNFRSLAAFMGGSDDDDDDDSDSEPCSPPSALSESSYGSSPQLRLAPLTSYRSQPHALAGDDHPPGSMTTTAGQGRAGGPAAGEGRPGSTTRDAVLARELLQHEMDLMLERDEELARQLSEEINGEDQPHSPLARPLAMFMPGGMQGRARHFPSIPNRHDLGRHLRSRERGGGGPRRLRLLPGLDGSLRMGFDPRGRGGGGGGGGGMMRVVMGANGPRRASSSSDTHSATGLGSLSESTSPDDEGSLHSNEFDPDERLLGGGDVDSSDDFLSMMNDPSLMLLMLLLRAPDTLYQNDGGVDLDDYEGLWELAERIGDVRRRGITQEQIGRLPTLKFKSQSSEAPAAAAAAAAGGGDGGVGVGVSVGVAGSLQCQICLVDFENGDCLRCIPCKHDFHRDCIDQWLKRNATCPICRQDIKPEES